MCFQSPKINLPNILPAPQRDPNSGLAKFASLLAGRSRGSLDTTATSPLGDVGYGKNVSKPTVLGASGQ